MATFVAKNSGEVKKKPMMILKEIKTKIYPGENPKWRWQSWLSYVTQNSFPFVSFDKEGIINVFIKTVLPWFSNIYNDRQ